jgi:hypothetical protein
MLVGDEDAVEVAELVEAGREIAGVDEDAHIAALDQEARVPEVSDPHTATLATT